MVNEENITSRAGLEYDLARLAHTLSKRYANLGRILTLQGNHDGAAAVAVSSRNAGCVAGDLLERSRDTLEELAHSSR